MSQKNRKIICLDFDGVIANTGQIKSQWIATELGIRVPPEHCARTQCIPRIGLNNYNRMAEYVYSRETSLLTKPMPGSISSIVQLSLQARLFIITARTEMHSRWMEEWLHLYEIHDKFEDIITTAVTGKTKIAIQLGASAIVDNDERHFEESKQSKLQKYHFALFIRKSYIYIEDKDIIRVRNWRTLFSLLMKP